MLPQPVYWSYCVYSVLLPWCSPTDALVLTFSPPPLLQSSLSPEGRVWWTSPIKGCIELFKSQYLAQESTLFQCSKDTLQYAWLEFFWRLIPLSTPPNVLNNIMFYVMYHVLILILFSHSWQCFKSKQCAIFQKTKYWCINRTSLLYVHMCAHKQIHIDIITKFTKKQWYMKCLWKALSWEHSILTINFTHSSKWLFFCPRLCIRFIGLNFPP